MGPDRGFILESTHRVEDGRTVFVVWGRLHNGASVLIRDDSFVPHFWVRAAQVARLPREIRTEARGERSMTGDEVVRVFAPTPADLRRLADDCRARGLETFEADVRPAMAWRVDRGLRSAFEVSGAHRPGERVDRVYSNPHVTPCDDRPSLRVVSFDIETDPRGRELLSIALTDGERSRVLLRTAPGQSCPGGAIAVHDERELLNRFEITLRELDPDVITGWNIIEFDLPVLKRAAERLGCSLQLGRAPGFPRFSAQGQHVAITGRVVLDGIRLLRGAFVRMDSYALDAVAREVLGEGKVISGKNRADEILRMFDEDRETFVRYNLRDAELVLEILDRLQLIELCVERSLLTGMSLDRVTSSTGAFDSLYLLRLRQLGIVAPTTGEGEEEHEPTTGAQVYEPVPGLHRNIWVYDFKSLYPSIIRTFQIDPLGLVREGDEGVDAIVAPNGASFRREPGILPQILDALMPRREEAKRAHNDVASQAIKILMNSFYGVLGTPACRFHSGLLSNAITSFGRHLLDWTRDRFEALGHRVLYGDTDSLFVESRIGDGEEARQRGAELGRVVNRDLDAYVEREWRVTSRLELEFERLYLRLHLTHMRH
ncbi:MAG: DNA polymerase II, partial [Planctomycetes bacterium]|nr:DNA polymerase II [Planctomycetota bacterium]